MSRMLKMTLSATALAYFGARINPEDTLRLKRGGGDNARLRIVGGVLSLKPSSRKDHPIGADWIEGGKTPEMYISGINLETGIGTFEAFDTAPVLGDYAFAKDGSRGFHVLGKLPVAGEGEADPAWDVRFELAPIEAKVEDEPQAVKPVEKAKGKVKELATA